MSKHSISQRILRQVLLLSSVLALGASILQFVMEYQLKREAIEQVIQSVEAASEVGLAMAIWLYDYEQIEAMAHGILNFRYVSHVRLVSDGQILFEEATPQARADDPVRSTTLNRRLQDRVMPLGNLEITIDTRGIFADVLAQMLAPLVLQMVLIGLIAVTVFQLFRRQVTGYLGLVADHLLGFDMITGQPLRLPGKIDRKDEIDVLVASFNSFQERLQAANRDQNAAIEKLYASEARYRSLVEQAPDAILVIDVEKNRFVDANANAERLFGLSHQSLLAMAPQELYDQQPTDGLPMAEFLKVFNKQLLSPGSAPMIRQIRSAKGDTLSCEVRIARLDFGHGHLIRASFLDITARLHAEDQMRISLREKEILLQEVYHRTKNNMQVIAALLEMKAILSPDGVTGSILRDMVQRIKAMALVHQKLYQSRDLSRILIKEYLADLIVLLEESMGTRRKDLEFRLMVEENFELLIDTAVPLGLVVNELVTNSCKYAFAVGVPGKISITIRRQDEDSLEMLFEDDGVGLPDGFELARDAGMGLRTACSLIKDQLQGSMELVKGHGTTWRLRFNHHLYLSRI